MRAQSFQYVLDVDLACIVGVNEAILLKNIAYWVFRNESNAKNYQDGRYWTYNSMDAYTKLFPFWTVNMIRTILNKLIQNGWIEKRAYNQDRFNHTSWYTLTDKGLDYFQGGISQKNDQSAMPDSTHRYEKHDTSMCENRQLDSLKSTHRCVENHNSMCENPQIDAGKFPDHDLGNFPNRCGEKPKSTYIQNNTIQRNNQEDARARAMAAPAALPFDLLPDSPLKEALLSYRESRRNLQAPMTDRAEQLALEMLASLAPGDTKTQIAIVNQSVLNGWRGLFQLKILQEPMQRQRPQNTQPASGYRQRTAGDDARATYEEALKYLDEMDDDGNFRTEEGAMISSSETAQQDIPSPVAEDAENPPESGADVPKPAEETSFSLSDEQREKRRQDCAKLRARLEQSFDAERE